MPQYSRRSRTRPFNQTYSISRRTKGFSCPPPNYRFVSNQLSLQEAIDGAAKEGHLETVSWLSRNTNAGATKAAMVRGLSLPPLFPVFRWNVFFALKPNTASTVAATLCNALLAQESQKASSQVSLKIVPSAVVPMYVRILSVVVYNTPRHFPLFVTDVVALMAYRVELVSEGVSVAKASNLFLVPLSEGATQLIFDDITAQPPLISCFTCCCCCCCCCGAAKDSAAANGYLSVVEWLHHNRREGCTVSAMNWAAEKGHLSVVKWLHQHRCVLKLTLAEAQPHTLCPMPICVLLFPTCSSV